MNSAPITLESLAVRVAALEHASDNNHESHGAIYARLDSIEKEHSVLRAVFDTNLNNIWKVLNEIQADLKEIKGKPGKRWDMVVTESIKWFLLVALGVLVVTK